MYTTPIQDPENIMEEGVQEEELEDGKGCRETLSSGYGMGIAIMNTEMNNRDDFLHDVCRE